MPDLSSQIAALAAAAKSTSLDGVTVQEQEIKEVIEADKYLAAKAGVANSSRGLRFNKLVPPGTAGT